MCSKLSDNGLEGSAATFAEDFESQDCLNDILLSDLAPTLGAVANDGELELFESFGNVGWQGWK
jgi:hypothetical protein